MKIKERLKLINEGGKKQISSLLQKGALHIIIGNFVSKFVSFFASIFVVRFLTKSEYGILSYIENIFSYFYLAAGLGLHYGLLRYCTIERKQEDKYAVYKYSTVFGSILNIPIVLIGIAFVYLYPHPSEYLSVKNLLAIYLTLIPLKYIVQCNLFTDRGMISYKRYAANALFIAIGLILFRVIGAYIMQIRGLILFVVSFETVVAIYMPYSTKRRYFNRITSAGISKDKKKEIFKYSIQILITNSLWTIFMLNDIFMLGQFGSGSTALADYKVAYVLPANIAIISTSIGLFVNPFFAKHEHEGNYNWVRKNYVRVMLSSTLIIGTLVLILILFTPKIVIFLYGNKYKSIVPIMRVLLLAALINNGFRYSCANILASMGKVKYNMFVSIVGIVLQIVINYQLIPKYGAMGVAYASLIIYFIMAMVLNTVFLREYFPAKSNNQ